MIKSRKLRRAGHVARMEKARSAFKMLTHKPKGKRHSARPRRRWKDNIRIVLKEIGVNMIGMIRLIVNVVLNLRVP